MKTGEVKNDDLSRVMTFPVKAEDGKLFLDAETLFMQPEAEQEDGEQDGEDVA